MNFIEFLKRAEKVLSIYMAQEDYTGIQEKNEGIVSKNRI